MQASVGVTAARDSTGVKGTSRLDCSGYLLDVGKFRIQVAGQLVRVQSQTIYYVLTRINGVCSASINRQGIADIAREQ